MRRAFLFIGVAVVLAMTSGAGLAASAATAASGSAGSHAAAPPHKPSVLLVCNGSTAPCPALTAPSHYYTTVQAAVNAARPGDWILIYPGVYHEKSKRWPTAGVWIQKPGLHIRGLNRNSVIIDGSKDSKGSAAHPCPSAAARQDFTPRDGIVVWKASRVTIQNLTVCDYLTGKTGHGNEIWWNGGDGSGKLGLGGYYGSYLTATSLYGPKDIRSPHLAQYGIFVSNARGPGLITRSYASNMADAAYYVGACQRQCNTALIQDVGVNSSLGYSGTNAGGRLLITGSVFEFNRTGLAPNSLNNDDAPPPQDGRCPGAKSSSCLVIIGNVIKDNNNANAPTSGLVPAVGAGVEISGGAFDTVAGNLIADQGSWGVVTHDYPDSEKPPPGSHCQGGIKSPGLCLFPARGNKIFGNHFRHVGFFGNKTNSDLATETLASYTPRNCFFNNVDHSGKLTSAPANIERRNVDGPPCGRRGTGNIAALLNQLICATGFGKCPVPARDARYPKQTRIVILPLPRLPTMPHPCKGVPRNAFCG
jgi:hypothetical protein